MVRHPVFQYAYFVEDLSVSAAQWARTLDAGPFFVAAHHRGDTFNYRGTEVEADVSYAFGYAGESQIQLVEQHDGCFTELHLHTERIVSTFARWKQANEQWDGTDDPLRTHTSGT